MIAPRVRYRTSPPSRRDANVGLYLGADFVADHDPDLDTSVPRGLAERLCSGDCVVTKNYSLLEPGLFARKCSARGIGVFLEIENTGEAVRLVNCNFDRRCVNLPRP